MIWFYDFVLVKVGSLKVGTYRTVRLLTNLQRVNPLRLCSLLFARIFSVAAMLGSFVDVARFGGRGLAFATGDLFALGELLKDFIIGLSDVFQALSDLINLEYPPQNVRSNEEK